MMLGRINATRPTKQFRWPAPSQGWVQSGNIVNASPKQAEVLDNLFPTAQGARLRGGLTERADLGAAVRRLFTYASGDAAVLFGTTATGVYDTADATLPVVGATTSGDWSVQQISTSGGEFLVCVNGSDYAHFYDGTDWSPIAGAGLNALAFDALATAFTVGETVTGGSSGASAEIIGILPTAADEGTLILGAITSGPFTDDEAITSAGGAAVADGGSASGSAIAITGVATTALSQVSLYANRLFFVEKGTMTVWYLPVEAIGGAAADLNLGSVFRDGGSVLFTATWSVDSGEGLDDLFVAVSTNGEVAIYQGTDPGDDEAWFLQGVYRISKPLDKHAWFNAGGDLVLLTEDGIIPVSQVIAKDRAALQESAITYPIEDAWRSVIASRTVTYPITATLWQSQTMLVVGTPLRVSNVPAAFVANAKTGAWCRFTGWDVRCSAVFDDKLYFGTNAGMVYRGDVGGTDAGMEYTGWYVPKHNECGTLATKDANAAHVLYRAAEELDVHLDAVSDYETGDPPSVATSVAFTGSSWGTGVWGTFIWGTGEATQVQNLWRGAVASGITLAPSVAVKSNQIDRIDFELLATQLRFEEGNPL